MYISGRDDTYNVNSENNNMENEVFLLTDEEAVYFRSLCGGLPGSTSLPHQKPEQFNHPNDSGYFQLLTSMDVLTSQYKEFIIESHPLVQSALRKNETYESTHFFFFFCCFIF
jgi:hypothetical protein